ncbi:TetR/AcrR family transcriptional regulator [bacterium SCSIO 12643]|nr:TetR/AcrR family transcriptional regulator [bacterium SCSIO 12643]
MKTKEKILSSALNLFNQQGVSSISLRDIAQSTGISKGNIGYHFPLKEDIVYQLYTQMKEELYEISKQFVSTPDLLEMLLNAPILTYELSHKYRFLYTEYVHVLQQYPRIKEEHQQEVSERKNQFKFILQGLQSTQILRNDISKPQWDIILQQSGLVRTMWFAYTAFQQDLSKKDKLWNYVEMVNQLLWPYLTPKGISQYDQITQKIKKSLM